MSEERYVIGFKIRALTPRGHNAILKNGKIPMMLKAVIGKTVTRIDPLEVYIYIKDKVFKNSKQDSIKKLVFSGAEKLLEAVNGEMEKSKCVVNVDFVMEAVYNE